MTERELCEIRAQAAKRSGSDEDYPPKLRERICAWVTRRRSEFAFWTEISREVGVPASTLKRWTRPRADRVTAFARVEVVDAVPFNTITLVAPTGVRVEGVTISEAIAILRGLT